MKTKHTPGPWKIETYHGCLFKIERDGELDEYPERRTEADARLIAAAPEMLRECKYALEFLKDWAKVNECAHDQGYQNFKFRLERAIAKAEGKE
tara:strand:- start:3414 stop:3695 length:282 start_codon:yes stop_codon:yes gene_type:complete